MTCYAPRSRHRKGLNEMAGFGIFKAVSWDGNYITYLTRSRTCGRDIESIERNFLTGHNRCHWQVVTDRLWDRLRDINAVVVLAGESYRGARRGIE